MESVKLPPNFDLRAANAATEWQLWLQSFEDFLIGSGKEDASGKIKLSLLRNMMGVEATRVLWTLSLTDEESKDYDKVIEAITKYISPRKNEVFIRYKFNDRKQKEGESFDNFYTDCKELLKQCNFNNQTEPLEDQMLRDKIVHGIYDKSLQESLLRIEELNLNKATDLCRAAEISRKQVKEMNPEIEVDAVKKIKQHTGPETKLFNCRRCQRKHGPKECPAYGKKCAKCGIENHFAISCRVRKVQLVREKRQEDHFTRSRTPSSEESFKCHKVKQINNKNCKSEWMETIEIEKYPIVCRLDTGADVSIMPLRIYKNMKCNIKLLKCEQNLEAFQGSTIKPVGMVNLHCKFKNNECFENFMVVDCKSMLLGLPGCVSLNLIKRVNSIMLSKSIENNVEKVQFIECNKDIFEGYGQFPKPCNIPTTEHSPICHPSPKIPHVLLKPLKTELERLVARGAICKIEEIDSSACINRLVLVEKPNGKIRLCLDPVELNKCIIRKPQVLLTLEDIATKLQGMKYFSVLDLSEGFHHIKLNDEATWKCCFATPFGIYKYLVLPYGLSNSPDVFQEHIQNYFGDIPNVITWCDDILVMGETEKIHNDSLSKVVERARSVNAKFNKDKFQYKQSKVRYVGQIFSESGMSVDTDRVESLLKLKIPVNKEQLQRIIGSFNYVRRYVPAMAELMAPLCQLLRKEVEFQWLPIHDKAFMDLKNKITCAPALSPFNPKIKCTLQCDASKNGIGACLFQQDKNEIYRLVACASRTMNSAEINYSQTEKELLAVYFGTQKFHKYIYGATNISVQTDHKPLLSIMCKPISKVGSPRLRRLRIKLLNYSLNLSYVPGKDIHFADMLSRNSIKTDSKDHEMYEMVHSVSIHLPMSDQKKREFRVETSRDELLTQICKYYYSGWPKENKVSKECKPFYQFKDEVFVESGLVFLKNKIIVPKSLQNYVIKLVHEGHPGVSKCTAKARQLFYWPHMPHDIKKIIQRCRTCEKFKPSKIHEELIPHKIPKLRFSKVGTDIFDFAGKTYLVVVDYLSHWLEVIPLLNKSSKCVIYAFQEIFTRFGYPSSIVADNNPFSSLECKEYYNSKDICIINSSPHYPRSNGMAEKAVNIAKNLMRKAQEDNVDYRNFILSYNNTPLSGLNSSPSQILNSRILRTCIPITEAMLEPKVEKDIHKLLMLKQSITKNIHDRHTKKYNYEFKIGDKIVYKTPNDRYWRKGVIVNKDKHTPRSYWITKDGSTKILRRNTHHLKKSFTERSCIQRNFYDYEPNPNKSPDRVFTPSPQRSILEEEPTQPPVVLNTPICTRSGRVIKQKKILDL